MESHYNFISSWQLIPEKSLYSEGVAPKSMILSIELKDNYPPLFLFKQTWYTFDNQNLSTHYSCIGDGTKNKFEFPEIADYISMHIIDKDSFEIITTKKNIEVWHIQYTVNAKGYLEVHQTIRENNLSITKFDIYHKQLSVLPYASSVGAVAIVPTQEGIIKHKALQAMAEQTDMHLLQIKQQIELLASQAHAIQRRKELSMIVYSSKINFVPQIGQTYHLYERRDDTFLLSLVSPTEWGNVLPFKRFAGTVKLLADHTWTEIE